MLTSWTGSALLEAKAMEGQMGSKVAYQKTWSSPSYPGFLHQFSWMYSLLALYIKGHNI